MSVPGALDVDRSTGLIARGDNRLVNQRLASQRSLHQFLLDHLELLGFDHHLLLNRESAHKKLLVLLAIGHPVLHLKQSLLLLDRLGEVDHAQSFESFLLQ